MTSFIKAVTGKALWQTYLYQPTCTICGLSTGYVGPGMKAVLPADATAKVDFRLVPHQRAEEIKGLLERHLERMGFGLIQCKVLAAMDPSYTPLDSPFVEAAMRATRETYGVDPLLLPMSPVSGFAGLVDSNLGAPTISAGVGDSMSNPHGPNESVAIADYLEGVRFAVALLQNFAAAVP